MQPLTDITVVSLEQAIAAPFATRQLADLGARVIKIERPGAGDFTRHLDQTVSGQSSHFVWANRGKQSLTLNLKDAAGQEVLEKLLTRADVFVQNLAPGAVERLGFGRDRLPQTYPRLIVCNVSGYGASGPYRDKKAYDALIQAETGLFTITGSPDTPAKAGIAVADIAAAMYAYSGILTALLQRTQTGRGTVLDVSMFDALAEWMSYPAYYTMGGTPPPRTGASHATIAPYGLFETADSGTVMLSIQNEREWVRFCAVVLEKPALARDERFAANAARVANRPALRAEIEAVFTMLSTATVLERLDTAQIANAQSRTMQEYLNHPQLQARGRWTEVGSPAGPIPALLPPVIMQDMEPVMAAVPAVGEHSEMILRELGYAPSKIAELGESGVT